MQFEHQPALLARLLLFGELAVANDVQFPVEVKTEELALRQLNLLFLEGVSPVLVIRGVQFLKVGVQGSEDPVLSQLRLDPLVQVQLKNHPVNRSKGDPPIGPINVVHVKNTV